MINLKYLETLAKAATPGEWMGIGTDVYSDVDAHVAYCPTVCSSAKECCITKEQAERNAAFVAAMNPVAVLELVTELLKTQDELRKAQAERDWLATRIYHDGYLSCPGGKVRECQKVSCKNCWLEAASKAVEKEGKK